MDHHGYGHGYDWGAEHGHHFGWLLVGVGWLVLFAMVAFAVWVVRRLADQRRVVASTGPSADSALETVRMRYARGEVDRDEFVRVSADLGGAPPPA